MAGEVTVSVAGIDQALALLANINAQLETLTAVQAAHGAQLTSLTGKVVQLMATQADIDALTQQIANEQQALATAVTDLQQRAADAATAEAALAAAIAALKNANPALDITQLQAAANQFDAAGLQATVSAVDTSVASVQQLAADNAPPPPPAPGP